MDSPLQHAFKIASAFDHECADLHKMEFTPPKLTRLFAELTEARDKEILEQVERMARSVFAWSPNHLNSLLKDFREFFSRTRKPSPGVTSVKELLKMARQKLPETLDTHGHDADHKARFAQIFGRMERAREDNRAFFEKSKVELAKEINVLKMQAISTDYTINEINKIRVTQSERIAKLEAENARVREFCKEKDCRLSAQAQVIQEQDTELKKKQNQLYQWNRVAEYANTHYTGAAGADIPTIVYNSLCSWVNHLNEPKAPTLPPWSNRPTIELVDKLRGQISQLENVLATAHKQRQDAEQKAAISRMNLELAEKTNTALTDHARALSAKIPPSNGWVLKSKHEAAQRSLEHLRTIVRGRGKEIERLEKELEQAKIMACLPSNAKPELQQTYHVDYINEKGFACGFPCQAYNAQHALDQFTECVKEFKKVVAVVTNR